MHHLCVCHMCTNIKCSSFCVKSFLHIFRCCRVHYQTLAALQLSLISSRFTHNHIWWVLFGAATPLSLDTSKATLSSFGKKSNWELLLMERTWRAICSSVTFHTLAVWRRKDHLKHLSVRAKGITDRSSSLFIKFFNTSGRWTNITALTHLSDYHFILPGLNFKCWLWAQKETLVFWLLISISSVAVEVKGCTFIYQLQHLYSHRIKKAFSSLISS